MVAALVASDVNFGTDGEMTSVAEITATYANDTTTNALHPTYGGSPVSASNPIKVTDNPGDGTWQYVLTTEEHSGLSSDRASQVLEVVVSGGVVTSTSIKRGIGKENFWRTLPSAPSAFAAANKDVNDQYVLTWTEPTDTDNLVRGYHIYYHATDNPDPRQATRIATVPKGTTSWKDWGAVLATKGKWGISTLDKYGNESAVLYDDTTTGSNGELRPKRPKPALSLSTAPSTVDSGMTELDTRRSRFAGATWSEATMENATTYVWQAETCMFYDPDTGFETWRCTSTPGLHTYGQSNITFPPWSADGAKMCIIAWGRDSQAWLPATDANILMTVNADGTKLRPVVEAARRRGRGFMHWCPQIPGLFYELGEVFLGSPNTTADFSRSTIDNDGVVTQNVISPSPLPADARGSSTGSFNNGISSDGLKLMIPSPVTGTDRKLWPISVTPAGVATLEVNPGYPMERGYEAYGDQETPVNALHGGPRMDNPDGDVWLFPVKQGGAAASVHWRMKAVGSDPDGGPLYTGDDGNGDFGECWPENQSKNSTGVNPDAPWVADPVGTWDANDKVGYWSHAAQDRWGQLVSYANIQGALPEPPGGTGNYFEEIGVGVWDYKNHKHVIGSMGWGSQHIDWHGFCDTIVSSRGTNQDADYTNDAIRCCNYRRAYSQYDVAYTHTRRHGGTLYETFARPGQSPDGTKVCWTSEFLNATDASDLYWSVCHYPYPPTNLSAETGGGAEVEISFLPPSYSSRLWAGAVAYAREVKQYRLWRKAA